MITKSALELRFMRTQAPMATVEIDLDTIPADHASYGELVEQALAGSGKRKPALRATIYVYQGPSVNFGERTSSAFFGVAGDQDVLRELYSVFKAVPGMRVRNSDSILASEAVCEYHFENGKCWKPQEEGDWYTGAAGKELPDVRDRGDRRAESDARASPVARILQALKGEGRSRQEVWQEVFDLLGTHRIDPNEVVGTNSRHSLLTMAAIEPNLEACERLIAHYADPENGGRVASRSVLTMMVWMRNAKWGSEHRKIVELLAPRTVNHQDSDGRTALMFASVGGGLFGSKRGNPRIIDQLIRLGADPLIKDRAGRTALMHAVFSNDKSRTSANDDVVELLKAHSLNYAAKQWFARHQRVEFSANGDMSVAPKKESGQPRALRHDALVGTITKKLEDRFGLPEGSVALVDRKGKALRDHDSIGTLRKRHN